MRRTFISTAGATTDCSLLPFHTPLPLKLDEAVDLVAAFECFDERDEGKIDAGELRYWLGEVGDRMTDAEVSGWRAGEGGIEKTVPRPCRRHGAKHKPRLTPLLVARDRRLTGCCPGRLWIEAGATSTTRHVSDPFAREQLAAAACMWPSTERRSALSHLPVSSPFPQSSKQSR